MELIGESEPQVQVTSGPSAAALTAAHAYNSLSDASTADFSSTTSIAPAKNDLKLEGMASALSLHTGTGTEADADEKKLLEAAIEQQQRTVETGSDSSTKGSARDGTTSTGPSATAGHSTSKGKKKKKNRSRKKRGRNSQSSIGIL